MWVLLSFNSVYSMCIPSIVMLCSPRCRGGDVVSRFTTQRRVSVLLCFISEELQLNFLGQRILAVWCYGLHLIFEDSHWFIRLIITEVRWRIYYINNSEISEVRQTEQITTFISMRKPRYPRMRLVFNCKPILIIWKKNTNSGGLV